MTLQGFLETVGIIYLGINGIYGYLQEGKETGKAAVWAVLWPIWAICGILTGDDN